jgi:uncharacterized membrane protein YphA (DoxX/SURF4 family)
MILKNLDYIGKLMFVVPMAYFGFTHLSNTNEMASLVPGFLPMPVLWVFLTGMGLVLACIAIVLGIRDKLAAQLLGIMLLIFAFMIHLPAGLQGDSQEMFAFFENFALAGGALYISSHLRK